MHKRRADGVLIGASAFKNKPLIFYRGLALLANGKRFQSQLEWTSDAREIRFNHAGCASFEFCLID
jgi:hypothetical protein